MASEQQVRSMPPALALLQNIARQDLPAVQAALAGGCQLEWRGISALHMCAFCNWADPIPLLLARGARLDALLGEGARWSSEGLVGRLQGVGVPEDLCTAALPLYQCRTALELAACCGADAVIVALLAAAGAGREQQQQQQQQADAAFLQLEALAKRQARALQPEAAATAVPAVVQRCAAALLAGGTAGMHAHEVAVRLAFPFAAPARYGAATNDSGFPPCPFLLQQLLQLHKAGQVPAAADAVRTICKALAQCGKQCAKQGAAELRKLGSVLAAWLRLPAADELEGGSLSTLLEQACTAGLTVALPALLALAPMQAQLRAEAELSVALVWRHADANRYAPLVCAAASSGSVAVLDAVLAAGGAVTLNAINQAVAAAVCARCSDQRSLRTLQLLLRRGRPPVPTDVAALLSCSGGNMAAELCHRVCPIYNLLCILSAEMDVLVIDLFDEANSTEVAPGDAALQGLHQRALAVMDALADAGYRPSTFTNCPHRGPPRMPPPPGERPMLPTFYPPDDASFAASLELHAGCRWLWLAAQRLPWSPEAHATFPPAFKSAARALLLAAHRGTALAAGASGSAAGAGALHLGRLPRELLHGILGRAAYPLSEWAPRMEGGKHLSEVQAWEPPDDYYSDEYGCGYSYRDRYYW